MRDSVTQSESTEMPNKKDQYDHTRTQRAKAHLERLTEAKGQRLPVDFDADRLGKIDELVAEGYGRNKADVIRRAVDEAHERLHPSGKGSGEDVPASPEKNQSSS